MTRPFEPPQPSARGIQAMERAVRGVPAVVGWSWLISRLLFFLPLALSVQLRAPGELAERLRQWDAAHYLQIVAEGYSGDNFAFFPFFPAVTKAVAAVLQLAPLPVALVLTNGAFLMALVVLERLSRRCLGEQAARAVVLLTCFNPMSIFFAIPYTEAFYLLLTGLTLLVLLGSPLRVPGVAVLGALSSATRPTGVVILPSILIAFARQRGPAAGLVPSLGALGGLGAVALLNWRLSGDPLAFLHAQKAWEVNPGFNLSGLPFWLERLSKVFLGPANTKASALIDGVYPAQFSAVLAVAAVSVGLRRRHPGTSFALSLVAFLAYWLVAGMSGLNLLVVVGALLLCGWGLGRLPLEVWAFGVASLLAYLMKQHTMSLERHIFATVPLLMLQGAWFREHPRWLRFLVGFGALLLVIYALRFADGQWIG
ncbi:hypothetical protein NZK32_01140 [Cyanobium sp. FGCU-52]|nr:hypothetical protein [Cyanobium sp. FGCU52]